MKKNYDESVKITYNPNWPYIPSNPFRNLTIVSSGSSKTNALLKLIKHQWPYNDKIYLCNKDSFRSKNQLLINGRGKTWLKNKKIQRYSLVIHKILVMSFNENLEDYNPTKKRKELVVFDDMIADMDLIKN